MTTNTDRMYVSATGRAFRGSAQWGYRAWVASDGTVRVYDSVAGHWTTLHSLTARQQARARRLAQPCAEVL